MTGDRGDLDLSPGDRVDHADDRTERLEHGPGSRIGPYEIVRLIGAGGMGVVYEARDLRLERRVALKFLPPEYGRDSSAKERFLREARAASALEHPSLCNIHDLGETDDGRLYIVMALYEGETLKQRLREGPLPAAEVVEIAHHLARGLRRAHQAGIVHRDIKPANILLTDSGRPVILDFGVAKMGSDADLTRAGTTLGTPAYMSPEQASGRPADSRSDLWSLGAVMYEMLTGNRPFGGGEPQAAIYAILNEAPAPLPSDLPVELTVVVERLLAKQPDERFSTAEELLSALGGSDTQTVATTASATRRWWPIAAVLAVALAVGGAWLARRTDEPPAPAVLGAADRPTVAVLFFDNITGNADLSWMRTGITDMLVTDLAQSPGLDIVSTSRLHQVLERLDLLERDELPFDLVQQIAADLGAAVIVRGSFVQLGGTLQVGFEIEDLGAGLVLQAGSFDGTGAESLFQVVDDLSATIRSRFTSVSATDRPESIRAVTTDSPEAWRFYTEALELQRRARDREAIVLLEQAVELDSRFALALVNLGRFHRNIGHATEARRYLERALAEKDRLPLNRRLSIEASYYGARWTTYGRAIEIYRRAIEERPAAGSLRTNMANRLAFLERFDEALDQFELLIERDHSYFPMYTATAWILAAQGRFERARAVLAERIREAPDDWYNRTGLASVLTLEGRYDEAERELQEALRLRPLDQFVHWTAWRLAIERGHWSRATAAVEQLGDSTDPWERWRAETARSRIELYRGESAAALASLRRAGAVYDPPDAQVGLSHNLAARLLLQLDRPSEALAEAERAIAVADEEFPALEGTMLSALAHLALGDEPQARAVAADLRRRSGAEPSAIERRLQLRLDGELDLARGDPSAALANLEAAEALLPPRGVEFHDHVLPDHVAIWHALARIELAAGRPQSARQWLERITTSRSERVQYPVVWVRSHYQLGRLYESSGEPERAQQPFENFVNLWRSGDLDRAEIAAVIGRPAT